MKGELRDSGRVWEDPFPNSGCRLSPASPDVPAAPVCLPASPSLSQPLGARSSMGSLPGSQRFPETRLRRYF